MQDWQRIREVEEKIDTILIGLITSVSLVLMIILANINTLGAIVVVVGMVFADAMIISDYLYDPLFNPLGITQGVKSS